MIRCYADSSTNGAWVISDGPTIVGRYDDVFSAARDATTLRRRSSGRTCPDCGRSVHSDISCPSMAAEFDRIVARLKRERDQHESQDGNSRDNGRDCVSERAGCRRIRRSMAAC